MSYINKALQKAQSEKESPYAAYHNIIQAAEQKPEKKNDRWQKWRGVAEGLILIILLAGIIILLYRPEEKKELAKPTQPVAALPAVPAPIKVAEIHLNKETAASVNAEKAGPPPRIGSTDLNGHAPEIDVRALNDEAMQKQRAGKFEEAGAIYRKVIAKEPKNIRAVNNLGVVHMSQKRYKRAAIRFNEALAINPRYVDAYYNLACLYSQKREVARSLHYLTQAVKINPAVREWAKTDADLKEIRKFPEFESLMEGREN
jgi:tetratricopeptide (TPR) repeat protein